MCSTKAISHLEKESLVKCIGEARLDVRIVRRVAGSFSSFIFATKGLGKTVRYNDTRDANKHAKCFL
jgi:hypothetical protein